MRRRLLWLTPLLCSGALGIRADVHPPIALELLSEHHLPGGTRYEDTCVGGLSALFYDRSNDLYYAVSDSRRDARFYTLRVGIAEGDGKGEAPRIAGVTFESVVRLSTREGLPYPDGRVDPEGFALMGDGSAFVSSEGVASEGVPPFVDRVDVATGEWLGTVPVPFELRPRHHGSDQARGVRNNLGLESLTLSPDRRHLYVASESALAQDVGASLAAGEEHFARLLHYELEPAPRLVEQYLYPLVSPPGEIVVHGLVELLALDDRGHLLTLERTFGRRIGMEIRLFEVRLAEARSRNAPSRLSPPRQTSPILEKRLVLDFGGLPVLLDNFEGLTFGPRLADGSESLLVLGDNDNTDCAPPKRLSQLRPTTLLLFRLKRRAP